MIPAALDTDLYELTMAAAYEAEGLEHEATFELFVRSLPPERRFLVAAGLEDALAGLETWCFARDDVDFLGARHFRRRGFRPVRGQVGRARHAERGEDQQRDHAETDARVHAGFTSVRQWRQYSAPGQTARRSASDMLSAAPSSRNDASMVHMNA